ncbi:dihydrolipoyl dehydrogenase family protein [Salipiger mangrovisoli]|uniref:FAD-dependent oxidoreductase n=1 Tax=Salipiger mangrovisoli TaxID=2865933 RepID=A0ABR9X5T6_9RHOB|nr:FAD-dependent oxidoreductase [Salipiger mangrovisoli]MBE9638968.1 FAD-dependent oxidoreductase [Salipiger mangrovisoli]
METIRTDLLVIGAGSGGLSVAAGAVQMGASVVLVERGEMGGDCLNYGCVPSKALIAAAAQAHVAQTSAAFGVDLDRPKVDWPRVRAHVQETIARIAPVDSQERFEGLGVRVIRDHARFVSDREVEAGRCRIAARRIVLATGSAAAVPPVPGLANVSFMTNETLWDLQELPSHLLILGGGPIGMEMAQSFRRLGAQVTVVEGAKALGREDPEMAAIVLDRLRGEGVTILEGETVSSASQQGSAIELRLSGGGSLTGSHLLVAAGRRANTEGLGLAVAGIETTKTGLRVDAGLRTTNRRVYAIGDAAGGMQFTHVAGYHAGIILRSALFGLPAKATTDHIPRATYTRPELAHVGLSEVEARQRFGGKLEVLRAALLHNDRAIAERETAGLAKVMVHRGRPVGATIVGPQAGDLISTWALAISAKTKIGQIAGMVAPYPTLGELNKRVAGSYFTPRLFENRTVKAVTRTVQRLLP